MHEFLFAIRWLLVLAFLASCGWFAFVVIQLRAVKPATPLRRTGPGQRSNTPIPSSRPMSDAVSAHQARGEASTRKLPAAVIASAAAAATPIHQQPAPVVPAVPAPAVRKDAESEAMDGLFAGLGKQDETPVPPSQATPQQKAVRMEELGFHTGPSQSGDRKRTEPTALPTEPTETIAKPRTQTAELDDILKRIDAVLAEGDGPQAEQTLITGTYAPNVPTTPPVAKPTDPPAAGDQQKLF